MLISEEYMSSFFYDDTKNKNTRFPLIAHAGFPPKKKCELAWKRTNLNKTRDLFFERRTRHGMLYHMFAWS